MYSLLDFVYYLLFADCKRNMRQRNGSCNPVPKMQNFIDPPSEPSELFDLSVLSVLSEHRTDRIYKHEIRKI